MGVYLYDAAMAETAFAQTHRTHSAGRSLIASNHALVAKVPRSREMLIIGGRGGGCIWELCTFCSILCNPKTALK